MGLTVFSTLSRKKEPFTTIEAGKVRMYVCGPTVYAKAHVGHAMSALVFDIIKRYLIYRGYDVKHVMNFTDVDDKIIARAAQLGTDPFLLAQGYIHDFEEHLKALNILPATVNPRATLEMPNILRMVQDLIEKGFAYEAGGDVYFRVEKMEGYGKLSGRRLEDMQAGARIEVDERKENPMDFALWKAAKPGEPAWDSPWGKGRPGWHIECSAMSLTHLGEELDIHGGGNDLIFPHHENEIAQSESLTNKPFARYWIHNGMLQLSGEKMSKSLGNLVTIEDFLEKHTGDALRMMVLNSSYRSPLTFNDEVIGQAEAALERLKSALKTAEAQSAGIATTVDLDNKVTGVKEAFLKNMDDDFNSAGALGVLFDFVKVINQARADGASQTQLDDAQNMLRELTGVLGLTLDTPHSSHPADAFIALLLELRQELRVEKQYALSDKIRVRLEEQGVAIEDGKSGTTWHWA